MGKVIVIGGGAAGMFAAYHAAERGHAVLLLEQNEKLGKKLFITGKGRCNLANAGDMEDLFAHVASNPKFLYSAFYAFDNNRVLGFFEEQGMKIKIERGNRAFPLSDHSSDVIAALSRGLQKKKVEVRLHTKVKELLWEKNPVLEGKIEESENIDPLPEKDSGHMGHVTGVRLSDGGCIYAEAVIVATGGLSYPSTGATGDGFRFAKGSGHKIVEPTPSLVPMDIKEGWCRELMGLSLKNTAIALYAGKKKLYEDFGEMLFTHFGVSGPMILSASAAIAPKWFAEELQLLVDLKPALDMEQLDKRILRDFEAAKNKKFSNSLGGLLPAKLIPVMVDLSGIDPQKQVNEVTREERRKLAGLLKRLPLTVVGLRGWNEAIITKGGVSVKEINPSTMESRRVKNLYFCGEVLDVDAFTGGYNLQIAWSTGYLAGSSIS